jgi:hypothetical protein
VNDQGCNENEDVESLDASRIKARQGAGFFATYHAYPYYPDFMNNDYLTETAPYLAYLQRLKRHHGRQPVLVAEFGVPSSREATHWQRQGWHHGGHDEQAQGAINGQMALEIYRAGMAGAVMFSWFDEWFKRNWLFLPYELPAERKPFWFNLQDAEQNYGVMATYPGYPGKKTTLSGRPEEWRTASTLYEKPAAAPVFRFSDGGDAARTLVKLQAQHDEGFLYLRLETAAAVNFARAHYLIGLSTCGKENGEFQLPFLTNAVSPVGLTFLVHLAGSGQSRILVCRSYDKYLNADTRTIRPLASTAGEWVTMLNPAGGRRVSRDGKRHFPARVFSMGNLRHGSLDQAHPDYNSLADFFVSGSSVELRIPWSLINIADPSSRQAIWFEGEKRTVTIDGIGLVACSYSPSGKGFTARKTAGRNNLTDTLPLQQKADAVSCYRWEGWQTPVFHTYLKQSYYRYREALSQIPEIIHAG